MSIASCARSSARLLRHGLMLVMALALPLAWAGLPELVEKAKPSLVAVGYYNALKNPRFNFQGTGFVVGNGSLVISNAHVMASGAAVDLDAKLMVLLPRDAGEPELRSANIVESDPLHDLVLLRVEGSPLQALRLGESAAVREGQSIALMGFPIAGALGMRPVTHRGIVSSITRVALPAPTSRQLDEKAIRQLREGPFTMFQLDATAYPGNSGGPLFDIDSGEVIGVVNMTLLKGTRESALSQPTGISYAIPSRFVAALIKDR